MTNSHSKIATNKDSWYMQDPDDENVALIPISNRPGRCARVDMNLIEEIGKHNTVWNSRGSNVYAQARSKITKKMTSLHRLVAFLVYRGFWSNRLAHIDHVNRNRLDNVSTNLRVVTPGENNANAVRVRYSRFPGVSFHKRFKKWTSRVKIGGKYKHLGYFVHEKDAAKMYRDTVREIDPQTDHPSWKELEDPHTKTVVINLNINLK